MGGINPITTAAAFWKSQATGESVSPDEIGVGDAIKYTIGTGLVLPFLVVGGISGCNGAVTDIVIVNEDTDDEPGTTYDEKTTLYMAGEEPIEEKAVSASLTTTGLIEDMSVTIGLNPDILNPRNLEDVDFPTTFENGAPPLFLEPDMAYATPYTVSDQVTTDGLYPDIALDYQQVGTNSVILNFTAISGADTYTIYNAETSDELAVVDVYDYPDPNALDFTYKLTGLETDEPYVLQVSTLVEGTDETIEYTSEAIPVRTHFIVEDEDLPDPFDVTDLASTEVTHLNVEAGATYVQANWYPLGYYSEACLFVAGETEAERCVITSGETVTFTGGAPGMDLEVQVRAFPGFLLEAERYADMDLSHPDYVTIIDVTSASCIIDGDEQTTISFDECENIAGGCTIEVGDVNQTIVCNANLKLYHPDILDETETRYDPHLPDGRVGIPFQSVWEGYYQ